MEERLASGDWLRRETTQPHAESGPRASEGKRKARKEHGAAGKDSPWIEVDWPTALDVAARKLSQVKAESGGDAIAVLTSAKCTSEENYLVNKLTRQVLGTNNIDHCARL
jgi:formate dehydrogenase major subunit/formate dehydrogenase alpha subunit